MQSKKNKIKKLKKLIEFKNLKLKGYLLILKIYIIIFKYFILPLSFINIFPLCRSLIYNI